MCNSRIVRLEPTAGFGVYREANSAGIGAAAESQGQPREESEMKRLIRWVAACSIVLASGAIAQGGVRVASGDVDGDGRGDQKTPPKDLKQKEEGKAAVAVPSLMRNTPRPSAASGDPGDGKSPVMLSPIARPGAPPPNPGGNVKGPTPGPMPNATNFGVLLGGGGGEAQPPKPSQQDVQAKPAAPTPALLVPAVQKAR
jgi:hypothetical protein